MVNDRGQLYTIEGIAAALILLVTAYFVVNSTSVYTPGDTHISDMQLEVLGTDALAMMDTMPNTTVGKSPLRQIVEQDDASRFNTLFPKTINARTGGMQDDVQYTVNVTYVVPNTESSIGSFHLANSSRPFTGTEHAVRVSRWVLVEGGFPGCSATSCQGKHAALVEVLVWRD